jgi:hypothetical protein
MEPRCPARAITGGVGFAGGSWAVYRVGFIFRIVVTRGEAASGSLRRKRWSTNSTSRLRLLACHVLRERDRHSPTSATGTGWDRTPWHAVQGAAREALRQGDVMYSGPTFWISVAGRFVHLKCLDARNVRFCQNCSTPVGKCRCGANLRDALEGPSRLSEQAVWCTKCGQKYPFVSPRGCANEIHFS